MSPRFGRLSGRRNPWLRAGLYLTLLVFAFLYIYPFLLELGTSFKTETDAVNHPVNPVPHNWVVTAFTQLGQQDFPTWFMNSVVVAVFVTAGRLLFDSMAGYALARLRFRGRSGVFAAVIAVMAVPGVVLLIPKFLVIRTLGIYDTYPGLIIPLLADAAWRLHHETVLRVNTEASIEEAAHIDEAARSTPSGRSCCSMANAGAHGPDHPVVPGILERLLRLSSSPTQEPVAGHADHRRAGRLVSGQLGSATQYPLKLAAAVAMTVPVAVIFFIFQKHILRTDQGAVKE